MVHKQQRILANSGQRRYAAKLLALRTHGILTSHTRKTGRNLTTSSSPPTLFISREKCGLARCMLVGTQDGEIEILLSSFSDRIRKLT